MAQIVDIKMLQVSDAEKAKLMDFFANSSGNDNRTQFVTINGVTYYTGVNTADMGQNSAKWMLDHGL